MNKDSNQIKNPLVDLDEDISKIPIEFSYFEKVGLISLCIISIGILAFACLSLFIDIFIKTDFLSVFVDMTIIILCVAGIYFVINTFKRKMVTEMLIDTAFQEGVYNRMESLIENIATAQIGTDIVLDRISKIDLKVENILKEKKQGPVEYEYRKCFGDLMEESISLGTTFKFVIKAIFLIVITMAVFMFLVNFNLGRITPYATLSIFIIWWIFITNEYSLWEDMSAWTMVFMPILVVPITVMILSNLLNYNVLIAILYSLLGLYSFLYYIWAVYVATGSIPFVTTKINRFEESESESESEKRGEFFASQQKGIFQEVIEVVSYRFKKLKEKK